MSSPQEILMKLIQDALTKNPGQTTADAISLFNELKDIISHHIINNLPTLESKAAMLALIVGKKIEGKLLGCLGK